MVQTKHDILQVAETHFDVVFHGHGDLCGEVVGPAVPEVRELGSGIDQVAGIPFGEFLPQSLADGAWFCKSVGLVVAIAAAHCTILAQHAVVEQDPAQLRTFIVERGVPMGGKLYAEDLRDFRAVFRGDFR